MLRITGGSFRGRTLQTLPNLRTRPTQAKLRQALFNSIQGWIPGAKILDFFAGSGALGFEALSRGAIEVVFVENNRQAAKVIRKNAETLKVVDQIRILEESVSAFEKEESTLVGLGPFEVILADPPYRTGWELELLTKIPWKSLLAPEGVFCLEWGGDERGELPDHAPSLKKIREKKYGDSVLTSYQREES